MYPVNPLKLYLKTIKVSFILKKILSSFMVGCKEKLTYVPAKDY